jgi:hypothetical protein
MLMQLWHIDGLPDTGKPHLNHIGRIGHFTALVGVCLSDIPKPMMGNFTAFPGSHIVLEEYAEAKWRTTSLLSLLHPRAAISAVTASVTFQRAVPRLYRATCPSSSHVRFLLAPILVRHDPF